MSSIQISPPSQSEREYIEGSVRDNVRLDGRKNLEYRSISVENNVFPHVNGSSRVRVGGGMDILCTIKLEVLDLQNGGSSSFDGPTSADEGVLEFNIEYSPSCNLKCDERRLSDAGAQLSQQLQSVYTGSSAVDLKSLCIIPAKYCWAIYVDILILQADGDPLDACSIASFVALHCTKIPKVELSMGEYDKFEDFEISGDLADAVPLKVGNLPITVTLSKIGDAMILDPSSSESACATCSLTIAIGRQGECCGMSKVKGGTLSSSNIPDFINIASKTAVSIYSKLDEYHKSAASQEVSLEGKIFCDQALYRIGLLA